MSCRQYQPLLTIRATLILLTAFFGGCGAGALTFVATGSAPETLLVTGWTIAGATRLLNQIIAAETDASAGSHIP
ncbi:hypothetical protein [Actinomadura litoris]|uniref:hypothetical protein n=1 Tax=Actinomadura litoris TaxID=2678616 RepID=UPI001FA6E6AF|nr:hypothetical protein [Actinomadura litoris]